MECVGAAALLFEDETELPAGCAVGWLLALGGLSEVGAEVLFGVGELSGDVLGEDDAGGLELGAEVVGHGGAGASEDGFKVVPAGGGGVEDGELAVGGDAGGIEGDGFAGFGLGEGEFGWTLVEECGGEADVGVVVVGLGSGGLLPECFDGGRVAGGVLVVGEEGCLEGGAAGGVDLEEMIGELGGFGFITAGEAGGVPVEASHVFDGVGVVGAEGECVLGLLVEAACEA